MICDEVRRMLGAYADNELEPTRQSDLEKHLTGCLSCQAAAEEIKNFSALILMNIPVYKAPAELKARFKRRFDENLGLSRNGFPESVYR
jgi:anti-sigma factor RsiW